MTQNGTRPPGRGVLAGVAPAGSEAIAEAKIANLEIALVTSRTIGMALGILMERLKLSSEESFAVLVEASQQTHRKLHDVAAELAFTGELPHGGTLRRQTAVPATAQPRAGSCGEGWSRATRFDVTSLVDPDGTRGVIFLRGEIDTAPADDVIAEAVSLLSRGTIKRLVIDLAHVTFLDASGIGALVEVYRMTDEPGRRATLRNPSQVAAAVLKLTAIDQLFEQERRCQDRSVREPDIG
jgi:anti-anti-sigma factor